MDRYTIINTDGGFLDVEIFENGTSNKTTYSYGDIYVSYDINGFEKALIVTEKISGILILSIRYNKYGMCVECGSIVNNVSDIDLCYAELIACGEIYTNGQCGGTAGIISADNVIYSSTGNPDVSVKYELDSINAEIDDMPSVAIQWSNAITYGINDYVYDSGKIYKSKLSTNNNNLPTSISAWEYVRDGGRTIAYAPYSGGSVYWDNVLNKPDTFDPSEHIHNAFDIEQDEDHKFVSQIQIDTWDSKQDELVSGVNISTINGQTLLDGGNIEISASNIDWGDITNKPTEFNPSAHNHASTDITDFDPAVFNVLNTSLIGGNLVDIDNSFEGSLTLNVNINNASATADGLMSSSDYTKLAGIGAGIPAGGTAGQILTKVDATNYNATWQDNYADWTSVIKHQVKNNGSVQITKGSAVYVTSSNGTNMLVGLASNTSEATSSKTIGLVESTLTTSGPNSTGFVITEGLLGGLNTGTASIGDPVWLGTNGELLYGLTNKPYAPAHLVFIGIVTKVSSGNGEIFVKPQNGFELQELHNIDLVTTTPVNGHILGYNGTLWVNKTIAGWLGFTPENASNKSDSYTAPSSSTYASTKALVDGLATKINTTSAGANNGVAQLDGTGKVPLSQLPNIVEQYTNFAAFPPTGDTAKLYLDKSTRLIWYWDSSTLSYIKEGSFSSNFTVYLSQSNGYKTFMKWQNNEVVPAAGKHPSELLLEGAVEAIAPTVTLTSPTTIQFNQTSISNVLNFTKSVNLPGTSVASVSLEWRRNGTGSWTVLSTNTALTTYTHTLTDTNFNTQPFNYRYIVVDNLGGTTTKTLDITPSAYVAPSISSFTTSQGTTRELGNTTSTITGTITRNSALVPLTSYQIQYNIGGGWLSIAGSLTSISGASASISYTHTDAALVNSASIQYRVSIIDSYQTTTAGSYTVNFYHKNSIVYNTATSITMSDINAVSSGISYTNSKVRTISGITATGGNYTYYVYASSAGDLTSIIMDGAAPVIGAFTKLTDISGTNSYGATVSYRIYKSNSTNAFTNNSLAFS